MNPQESGNLEEQNQETLEDLGVLLFEDDDYQIVFYFLYTSFITLVFIGCIVFVFYLVK